MNAAKIILALTLLAGVAATASWRRRQAWRRANQITGRINSARGGDTFGEPYSGTAAARRK